MTVYKIDFAQIKETALLGVRRTAVFLGLGLNAVNNPEYKDYRLYKFAHIEFVSENLSDEKVEGFKSEFGIWLVGNGLRELIEHFSVFLDQIYVACMFCAVHKKLKTPDHADKTTNLVRRSGLYDKVKSLSKEFGLSVDASGYLQSINKARACLTHPRGIVAQKDVNEGNNLILRWTGLDLLIQPEGESPIKLDLPLKEPIGPFNASHLKLALVDREVAFTVGKRIELTPKELAELCNFFILQTDRFIQKATEYVKSIGIVDA